MAKTSNNKYIRTRSATPSNAAICLAVRFIDNPLLCLEWVQYTTDVSAKKEKTNRYLRLGQNRERCLDFRESLLYTVKGHCMLSLVMYES